MKDIDELKSLCPEHPDDAAAYWLEILKDLQNRCEWISLEGYQKNIDVTVKALRDLATELDKLSTDTGISKTVGGGVSIAGGLMAAAGIVFAPVTAGVSLLLTVGGVTSGLLGSATSLGAGIAKGTIEGKKVKEANVKIEVAVRDTTYIREIMSEFMHIFEEDTDEVQLHELNNEVYLSGESDNAILYGKAALKLKDVVSSGKSIGKAVKKLHNLKKVSKLKDPTKTLSLISGGRSVKGIAEAASAPSVKMFSKTLIPAGSTSAKLFAGASVVLGIGAGVIDCVDGAMNIKNGSTAAKYFRDIAESLEKDSSEVAQVYYSVISNY